MKYNGITYRIAAFLLAILVFVTSVGLSVDMHFCQGDFKSFSLIGKAKNCHDIAKKQSTCKHHKAFVQQEDSCGESEQKDCCENRTLSLNSDQDQQFQTVDFTLSKQVEQFITAFIYVFYQDKITEEEDVFFAQYRPPLIQKDIPVLIQSFLL
ncbi:MAG: hypothetical protein ACI85O_001915 [Saprospiraceae bacterium]|jgi:hypothetical protein